MILTPRARQAARTSETKDRLSAAGDPTKPHGPDSRTTANRERAPHPKCTRVGAENSSVAFIGSRAARILPTVAARRDRDAPERAAATCRRVLGKGRTNLCTVSAAFRRAL